MIITKQNIEKIRKNALIKNDTTSANKSLLRKLIEVKCEIDGWNNLSSNLFLHPSKKSLIRNQLKDNDGFKQSHHDMLWGIDICYTSLVSENEGIMIDSSLSPSKRSAVVFKMN